VLDSLGHGVTSFLSASSSFARNSSTFSDGRRHGASRASSGARRSQTLRGSRRHRPGTHRALTLLLIDSERAALRHESDPCVGALLLGLVADERRARYLRHLDTEAIQAFAWALGDRSEQAASGEEEGEKW